ncbi:MAG: hypothetical protein U1E17_04400 [Geminicoccaceae bacterium]
MIGVPQTSLDLPPAEHAIVLALKGRSVGGPGDRLVGGGRGLAARARSAARILFKILLDLRFRDAGNIGPVTGCARPPAAVSCR